MSELDDFARTTVTPGLRPGETILAIGWMANGINWRNQPERWFAVGTNQRFIAIKTGAGLMFGTPKIGNEGVSEYELMHATGAVSRNIGALTDNVAFKMPQGDVAYAVPSPSIVGAGGVAGHADFVRTYLPWLCRHVAAGTLRTPEGTMAAAAEWQNRATLDQANDRYRATIGDTRVKSMRMVMWPVLLAIACLGLVPIGVFYNKDVDTQIGYVESHIEFLRKNANEPGIQWDPAVETAHDRAKIDRLKSGKIKGTLMTGGGAAGVIVFPILAIVLTIKKRARAQAAAAA